MLNSYLKFKDFERYKKIKDKKKEKSIKKVDIINNENKKLLLDNNIAEH